MRITYLLESVGHTGGNVVLFHHMEAFANDGHEVWMLSPFGEAKWEPGKLEMFLSGEELGYDGPWKYAKKVKAQMRKVFPDLEGRVSSAIRGDSLRSSYDITRRLISKWKDSDITIATHSKTANAAALLGNKTKSFYHIQGYEPWFSEDPIDQRIAELSYQLPIRKIANCNWLKEKLGSVGCDNVSLVRPGLNHLIFNQNNRSSMKLGNGAVFNKIRIVSYADSRPFKGWKDSCEAMQLVFQALGGDEYVDWTVFGNIESDDVDLPINYSGFLTHDDLAELYSSADIVFLPSWFESFPLQPLEAMACGAAVVTTAIGTSDYARDRDTAMVVPPKDPTALASAILELAKDSEFRMNIARRGVVESRKYTWEQSASEIRAALSQ
ncbi:glycosyltransferase family 4 protein [Marinobacter shengliensis]|uniref:glycosyltransferase family 4 protein n=1 Tax=Marinobacter shengliensis TaxID=1389223 RepID=UPI001E529F00|nr:glycosyltransferase family 4 protein [Marinobacter shengliensis]MCD1630757.1 glycosyltransferase family 4 protein [Marinobacter shengliensis]